MIKMIDGVEYNYQSKIVAIYERGQIVVQLLDGRQFTTTASNLSQEITCIRDDKCVGDQAIIEMIDGVRYNYQCEILNVFQNGKMIIKLADGRKFTTDSDNLVVQVRRSRPDPRPAPVRMKSCEVKFNDIGNAYVALKNCSYKQPSNAQEAHQLATCLNQGRQSIQTIVLDYAKTCSTYIQVNQQQLNTSGL